LFFAHLSTPGQELDGSVNIDFDSLRDPWQSLAILGAMQAMF
jgi:hypothetical protein